MTTTAVVLGCGPAGLLAAHAATLCGANVDIIAKDRVPSRIGGAQYLHRAIPELTDSKADGLVDFIFQGSMYGYAKKVYGDPHAPTSWQNYKAGLHKVWNMQAAYDTLWERYAHLIREYSITPDLEVVDTYDYIFSCIPAPAVCGHIPRCTFKSQDVWIYEDKDWLGKDMVIVYNGYPRYDWYRWSSLWGNSFFEFPQPGGHPEAFKITKPLWTDCPGHPWLPLIRLGRYGKWEKSQLIHHAFEGVLNALQ